LSCIACGETHAITEDGDRRIKTFLVANEAELVRREVKPSDEVATGILESKPFVRT